MRKLLTQVVNLLPESTYKTTTEYLITKTEEQRVRTCYTLLPTAARQQPPLKSGFAAWQPVRDPTNEIFLTMDTCHSRTVGPLLFLLLSFSKKCSTLLPHKITTLRSYKKHDKGQY